MPVTVFERSDLPTFEGFRQVQVLAARLEDEIGIVYGDLNAQSWRTDGVQRDASSEDETT